MPALEVLRQNIAANAVVSPVGVETVAAQQGNYRGQAVSNGDFNSKVTTASKALAHEAETQDMRSLFIRMMRKGQGTSALALGRIAEEFYEKLPNMPQREALQEVVEAMYAYLRSTNRSQKSGEDRSQDSRGDGEDDQRGESAETNNDEGKQVVFRVLQKFDADVSHQYAALQIARDHFESSGEDHEFLAVLDAAARAFEESDISRDVRAGIAAAQVAHANAATLETDPATVRDTYRSMLRERKNFGQLFDTLSKFAIVKSCDAVIETFRSVAGHDLSSTGPSTDPRFLHDLLTELGKLKQLQTVLDNVAELIRNTERILPPSERGQLQATQVTSRMLNFVGKSTVNLADAKALLCDIERSAAAGQVVFVNGLQNVHGAVPDVMLPSGQARLQQKVTLKSLSNNLVEAEEREFENALK